MGPFLSPSGREDCGRSGAILDLRGYGTQLLDGAAMTLAVAAISLLFGGAIGLVGAGAKLSRWAWLRSLAGAYTTIIRGVPELLILLLLYFGGTVTLSRLAGRYVEVDGLSAGVFALSLVFGAYATEVFRGAILAVPRGQIEAARALGLRRLAIFRRVTLPQVWRIALPGLGNLWLVLLKDTSLVSVVGLEELMRKSAIAAGVTRAPFLFYGAAALLYLAFTLVSTAALHYAERRVGRGFRSA
ncbi:MAG TPA: ABC transporter permease [Stellaceae bacterium]|nr:ABC transporter permease [Stellaceae bacterium]